MKLCFLIHDMTGRGGTERAQANVANALIDKGEHVTIWSCYQRADAPAFVIDQRAEIVYTRRKALRYFLDYPVLMIAFAAHVMRTKPDRIICTDANRVIIALLALLLRKVPLILWEHFALSHSVGKSRGRLARSLGARMASAIVVLTPGDIALYESLYRPTGRVVCIPNMVAGAREAEGERGKFVLAMGRLAPQKGFDLLLDAWRAASPQLPDWSLRIVGEGEMEQQLRATIELYGLTGSVTIEPYTADPFALYAQCGLFVLSSRFEGLPLVLMEAMSSGAPCISFDCPTGPADLIADGTSGILVAPEDTGALAAAIVALAGDDAKRRAVGSGARDVARAYSPDVIAQKWNELLYHQPV